MAARVDGFHQGRLARNHGEMSFYLTHVMNGHGNLGAYLERFKIRDSDACLRCGSAGVSAEHALSDCKNTEEYREDCETDTGPLSPASLLDNMLAFPEKWEAIATLARKVTKQELLITSLPSWM